MAAPASRRIVAPVGPGWVQTKPLGPFHILDRFPPPMHIGDRVNVWHGRVKVTAVSMFWAYTHQPDNPCHDCDRALQVWRIQALVARL